MEKQVIIERGTDGTYSCFVSEETPLKNGVFGYGSTVEEAKADFLEAYTEAVEQYGETENVSFSFAYDTASFLQAFSKKMSLAGLQVITGINRKQLNHYVTGHSKPSPTTVAKIEEGVKKFTKELNDLSFV